jgi:hypothetical protein
MGVRMVGGWVPAFRAAGPAGAIEGAREAGGDAMRDRILSFAALAAAGLALASPPPAALAGDNTLGKPYENKTVGFRFRPLNDWAAVPPGTDPNDPKVGGYYTDAAKFDRTAAKPQCDVYAFKRRSGEGTSTEGLAGSDEKPDAESMREQMMDAMRGRGLKDLYLAERQRYISNADSTLSSLDEKKKKKQLKEIDLAEPKEKIVKNGDVEITFLECEVPLALTDGRDSWVVEWRLVAGFTTNDEYEVGVFYQVPGSEWKKYGRTVYASIASLEFLAGEEVAAARKDLEEALAGKSGDERWVEELKKKVGPGWAFYQTKNYLLVYDKAVKEDRIRAIAIQIEAIRKDVYEVLYPPDRPITAVSVVRICKDKEQYTQYGGSPQSAGYWYWVAKELVFYEDVSAKKDSLRVLNHEAFHQYIFYSVGSISPHDWFNEGHGDYFSGFDFNSSGRFVPKAFDWRKGLIKGAMGSKSYIPLKTFVTYSHEQYYGPLISQNYAQGWSLIWFLRGTRNPEWKGIIPNYFNTLKTEVTNWVNDQIDSMKKDGKYQEGWKPDFVPPDVEQGARDKALKAAFGDFDDKKWARFEKEWLDFKY